MSVGEQKLERIAEAVEEGHPKDVEKLIQEAVQAGTSPLLILRDGLTPAIQNIGKRYREDEVYIIKILSSARAMKTGLKALQPYLEQERAFSCGKAIIGTAEGDLHDMGKNLVALMFETAGFQVIDLGVDVSEKKFLRSIRENPDAAVVCISSLLTTSMESMKRTVQVLNRYRDQFPFKVMVGGGPVTEEFAREIGADVYTADAYAAAEAAREMVKTEQKEQEGLL